MGKSRRYRVTGPHPVLRFPPGAVFDADLDPQQRDRMLARGSLAFSQAHAVTRVDQTRPTPDDAAPAEE